MMKPFLWITATVVVGIVGFYGAVITASEMGEVVTVTTYDSSGTPHETRLWIVDHDGTEWLRTGHDRKGWYVRLMENPKVVLERNGTTSTRLGVPVTAIDTTQSVNDQFKEKYGAADWFVALSGDATQRIPIRLDPIDPNPST